MLFTVDSFGYVLTNLTKNDLPENCEDSLISVQIDDNPEVFSLKKTFGHAKSGDVLALIGLSVWLEIAEVNGNAKTRLGARVGQGWWCHGRVELLHLVHEVYGATLFFESEIAAHRSVYVYSKIRLNFAERKSSNQTQWTEL